MASVKKITTKQLESYVKEQVHLTLKEYDRGDVEWQQSINTDQLVKNSDQLLDVLRGVIKNAAGKSQGANLIKNVNDTLNGFVTKVVAASKTIK